MKWRFRFKAPTRYNDIERCPYLSSTHPVEYNLWVKAQDERWEKENRSFKRFLWELRLFISEHIERY